jgi:hypothetical protein
MAATLPAAARPYHRSMPLALGQRLLFPQLGHGGLIAIVAVVATILIVRFWPLIVRRLEQWRRSR